MEFKASLPPCLLTKAHPLLLVPQLLRDTRKLKTDLVRTRLVPWTLLTSHNSQWDKKTAAASLPQFKSCSCKWQNRNCMQHPSGRESVANELSGTRSTGSTRRGEDGACQAIYCTLTLTLTPVNTSFSISSSFENIRGISTYRAPPTGHTVMNPSASHSEDLAP